MAGYFRELARAALDRPIKALASAIGYEPTSNGWRTRGYHPSDSGINALVESGGDGLRAWSRDLARKNAWASNALDSWESNCIGGGIKPQSKHPNPTRRKQLMEWWNRWTDQADANGLTDFYGLERMMCRGEFEAGEVLARKRLRRPSDGLFLPLQYQLLESEHLPTYKNEDLPNGNIIRAGIEFDLIGSRVAYHLYRERPNERIMFSGNLGNPVRVPADSVIHHFKPLRPGQHRGQPRMTPILIKLWELDQYDDAEVVRKKTAALITYIFWETAQDGDNIANTTDEDPAADGTPIGAIEPGSTVVAPPGLEPKPSQAADLTGQYEIFFKVQLRAIAAALGLTYEQLTGDMSGVNYSSARIAMLEFRRRCEQFQHQVHVFQVCRPTWKAFIEACVMVGLISAVDYARNQADYLNVQWRPPKWDWVDPKKDAEGEILLIDNLLKPRSATINEMGDDEEDVDAQILIDQEREQRLGLVRRQSSPVAATIKALTDPEANQ
jgi:lambda family phage portal protein